MTLLQDFHHLSRARGGVGQGDSNAMDSLESLAYTAAALLTASSRRKAQAGTGHTGHSRGLRVPCVEEDSGYQSSENEAEDENWKESGSGTLDLGYERTEGPARPSLSHHGGEIVDLSYQGGENGIAADGKEEFLESADGLRRKRRVRQSFSDYEVDILTLSNRREERGPTRYTTEENSALEHEIRKQKNTRRPFDSNGNQLLTLSHEMIKRETNGDSWSEDREHYNLANVRGEHERLRSILTDKREHLNTGVESRKRKLDPLSVDSETDDSGHERVKKRRSEVGISDEGADISNLGDGEWEERRKRTGDLKHDRLENVLSSERERTDRRRTGDDTREEFENMLKIKDEGKEEEAEEWDSARERTKGTEDSDSDAAGSDGDEVKRESETEEALDNPLAATSIHSRLLCCNNGFFRITGGTSSSFESNCGCTTHNLVDWRTRVTWTDPNLCHQVKVREVTVLSPFRTPTNHWGLSVSPWRSCPTPLPSPQPQHPIPLTQTPQPTVLATQPPDRAPQHPARGKKEQLEDDGSVEGERGYRCGQVGCGRTFCRNEELTRHLRIHSGQRPFVCQRCGRRFVRRDHLTKHQRTHLPAHVKRSYTCPLPACTHRYTRSDALTRHMWTAHHLRARQPSRGRRGSREEPDQDLK